MYHGMRLKSYPYSSPSTLTLFYYFVIYAVALTAVPRESFPLNNMSTSEPAPAEIN